MFRVSFVAALLGAAFVAAQTPTYTINLKTNVDVGKTVAIEMKADDSGTVKTFGPDGKVVDERPLKSEHNVYRLTELSRGSMNSWKSATVFSKALEGVPGKLKPLAWQERTIITERKDGVTKFGAVGKPTLNAEDLRVLISRANRKDRITDEEEERIMLPGKPVAVGEEWIIDAKAFAKQLPEMAIDPAASKYTGTLSKVFMKGPSQFGVLEIRMKFAVTAIGGTLVFKKPLSFDNKLVIETAIDGSSTERREDFTSTLIGRGQVVKGKETFTTEFDSGSLGWKTRSAEIDDPKAVINPAVTMVGPDDWTPYTSKGGKYRVEFPGKPVVSTKTNENEDTTVTASTETEGGNVYYAVSFTDYAKVAPGTEAKPVLDAILKRFEQGMTESKSIVLDDHTGVACVRSMEQSKVKMTLHYRAFYVDGRLYQIMAVVADSVRDRGEPAKFLDSFRFTKPEKKE